MSIESALWIPLVFSRDEHSSWIQYYEKNTFEEFDLSKVIFLNGVIIGSGKFLKDSTLGGYQQELSSN